MNRELSLQNGKIPVWEKHVKNYLKKTLKKLTAALPEKNFDNSGFSAEWTLIFASAVSHHRRGGGGLGGRGGGLSLS